MKWWKIVLLGAAALVVLYAAIFSWNYFTYRYSQAHVYVSVEYAPAKYILTDTITHKKIEIEVEPTTTMDDIKRMLKAKGGEQDFAAGDIFDVAEQISASDIKLLRVVVRNGTSKVIQKTWFQIGVFKKGHSTDLSKMNQVYSDKILKPGMIDTTRWEIPTDMKLESPKEYEYRILNKIVQFGETP